MTVARLFVVVARTTAVLVLAMSGLLASAPVLVMAGLLTAAPVLAAEVASPAPGRPPIGHNDAFYTFGIGTFAPEYTPPAPGSYELPPVDTIGDHALVDAEGHETTLAKVIGGRLAVVSFIYGTCSEATGCPLSTAVLHRLDAELAGDTRLARDVALVTVSFDPERDQPQLATMQKHRAPGSTWQFVTTRDEASLSPLLADFGQSVAKLRYSDGAWSGVYRHVLKVYLLDRQSRVRNIYSVGFLNPELVKNDLQTLRMAESKQSGR